MPYDPDAAFEVKQFDVEYRQDDDGPLLARIFQPQGPGPFPVLLRVHGGAWVRSDRLEQATLCEALAATGLLVASIDFRQAPRHPYPASVADVNHASRWLKAHAHDVNGDATRLGAHGNASGGHLAVLSGLRPRDARYAALELSDSPAADASLAYVVVTAPILDPYARYLFAQEIGREDLATRTMDYFLTQENMQEGNPQLILDRSEPVELPPLLILQGANDGNVTPAMQERFVAAYRAAGGEAQLEIFQDVAHGFGGGRDPESQHALRLTTQFIGRHIGTSAVHASG
jgi:acetyl esterase/lipase